MSYVFNPLTGKLDRVGGSWSAITGKPNTFPPSAHTHLWSHILDAPPDSVVVKLAPATTDLVLGAYPAIPSFPATVTISSIRADVDTPPEGSSIIIDMLRNNVSVLNNKLTINPTKTSTADSTPAPSFIPDGNQFSYGDKISFQVMQVGAINPGKGLTITLNGVKISAIDATNTLVLYNLKINTALDPGETGNNKFKLPLYPDQNYNFTIDWGDGYTETWESSSSPIHQYTTPGVYYIKITGDFPGFFFSQTLERKKVLEVHLRDLPLQSLDDSFTDCPNLIKVSGTTVTATSFQWAWSGCGNLTSFPNISFPNGSNFFAAWYNCSNLTSFPSISFPVATNFRSAWSHCSNLTSFPSISFPVATNFHAAWSYCHNLTFFPSISCPVATDFQYAWYGCSNLTSFPSISFPVATNFQYAWYSCINLTSFPAGVFDNWRGTPIEYCFYRSWEGCKLSKDSVENILVSIDTSGREAQSSWSNDGREITISYNTATGALSTATTNAITSLKNKNWIIRINGVVQ